MRIISVNTYIYKGSLSSLLVVYRQDNTLCTFDLPCHAKPLFSTSIPDAFYFGSQRQPCVDNSALDLPDVGLVTHLANMGF